MMRRRCLVAALALLSSLLPAHPARALLREELPLDHWAYPIIDELRLRGEDLVATGSLRPYWLPELTDSLRLARARAADGEDSSDAVIRRLLGILWEEFGEEARLVPLPGPSLEAAACWLEPEAGELPQGEETAKGVVRGELAAVWGERVSAYLRAELDSDGADDREFIGRPWRGGITGMVEYSSLSLWGDGWRISAGRGRPAWGPARRGGLVLSGDFPSLDGARVDLARGSVRFLFMAVALDAFTLRRSDVAGTSAEIMFPADDSPRRVPRYLSGHRLEWRAAEGLTLGASEVVVYGGPGRNWELSYLIPFVPFYNEQWNRGGNDNILVSFDAEWFPRRGHRLYGELLLDDFQYSFGREPHEVGVTIGWEEAGHILSPLVSGGLEYTRVNTTVYGQVLPWNRYTMNRAVLGEPQGSDMDRWTLDLALNPAERWALRGEAFYIRRGEMRPETPRPWRVTFPEGFPSGVVEESLGGRLSFEWRRPPWAFLRLWAGGERLSDFRHREGEKKTRFLVGAALRVGARVYHQVGRDRGMP